MTIVLYGHKNYRGKCVDIVQDFRDLKDSPLNYRTSSVQLTKDSDKALFYTERHWAGNLMFRTGKRDISDIRNPDTGGTPKFNNEIKSIRINPFKIKVKYHFMYIDGDLPGTHSGLPGIASLVAQINDMHEIVRDIWEPYLIDLQKDPILESYKSEKYFKIDVSIDELKKLKQDKAFNFSNTCLNVVLVEDVTDKEGNPVGVAKTGKLGKPVMAVEVRPAESLFKNARTIAHEIGHTFGLDHGNNTSNKRLMTQTGNVTGKIEEAVQLGQTEVEIVHETLATNEKIRPLLRLE